MTEVLGTDIATNSTNYSDVEYANDNDFKLLTSYTNLNQAIALRFMTTLGQIPWHSSYGSQLNSLRGAAQNEETLSQAILYATSALNSEPRVDTIIDVDSEFVIVDMDTVLSVSCSIKPIDTDDILNIVVVIQ